MKKQKKNRLWGILMGICLGILLCIGILMYQKYGSTNAMSQVNADEKIFQFAVQEIPEEEDDSLLNDITDWTQNGASSAETENQDKQCTEEATADNATAGGAMTQETMSETDIAEAVTSDTMGENGAQEVSQAEDEAQQNDEIVEPSGKTYIVIGDQSVNVRQQPSMNAAKVGMLKPGTKVTVIGSTDGWCQISGEVEGYVVERVLQLAP